MGTAKRRSGHLLLPSLTLMAGLAIGVLAAQGCGPTTPPAGHGVGAACSASNPCDAGLTCASGTCARSSTGQTDGGTTCGTAPVSDCGPCADGTACGADSVCTHGICENGCFIGGAFYLSGATNPTNACQSCDPTQSLTDWSPLASGTACTDDGNACTQDVCDGSGQCSHPAAAQGTACGTSGQCDGSGQCSQGCTIGGQFYGDGVANPADACQSCDVTQSTSAWTTRAPGDGCGNAMVCDATGTCQGGCYVGGQFYATGTANPADACQACVPATSTSAWTNAADGTSCDDGNACNGVSTCQAGACQQTTAPVTCTTPPSSCYAATGTCDTTSGSCSYTPSALGTACGAGQICDGAGACKSACDIGGQLYDAGSANPANPCQVCQPSASTSQWTNDATGTACGTGKVCNATATCVAGCFIGGSFFADGAANPGNACQVCTAAKSTTAWSNVANGTNCDDGNLCNGVNTCQAGACQQTTAPVTCTAAPVCHNNPGTCATTTGQCNYSASAAGTSCGAGQVCSGTGACLSDCYIGGQLYPNGTIDPANACLACNTTRSTTTWTTRNAGLGCGTGQICNGNGTCVSDCYIGGQLYAGGTKNPANDCQSCQPAVSTSAWTNLSSGAACASDGNACTADVCNGAGTCTHNATNGASCGPGLVCNGNACVNGCFISGQIYGANVTNPKNVCQVCTPSASTTAWSANNGVSCNDGNACTYNDTCSNQVCAGTSYTCSTTTQCQTSTCNGDGTCTVANASAGSACTSPCGAGYCDSSAVCTRCTTTGSSCCLGSFNPITGNTTWSCKASSSTVSCH